MRLNKKSLIWGAIGIGITILGMFVSSKQDDADFEDRANEWWENKQLEMKGDDEDDR